MLHLYAIVERAGTSAPLPPGLSDRPVRFVAASDLACVVSDIAEEDGACVAVAGTRADLAGRADASPSGMLRDGILRHERVIEGLMAEQAVLPSRFGTALDDDHACRRHLIRHREALLSKLRQVRDCVEFALRFSNGCVAQEMGGADDGLRPGTAYLRRLGHGRTGWPDASAAFPHDDLTARAEAHVLWPRTGTQPELRASVLVRNAQIVPFLREVAGFQRRRPQFALSCTGPWPPYSFANPDLTGDFA